MFPDLEDLMLLVPSRRNLEFQSNFADVIFQSSNVFRHSYINWRQNQRFLSRIILLNYLQISYLFHFQTVPCYEISCDHSWKWLFICFSVWTNSSNYSNIQIVGYRIVLFDSIFGHILGTEYYSNIRIIGTEYPNSWK